MKPSPLHGKGVFTTQKIMKGTILSCDVLPISSSDPNVQVYLFPYRGSLTCIHIGFASFLNGDLNPNLKHLNIDLNKNISFFEVLRDVDEGEELLLGYSA